MRITQPALHSRREVNFPEARSVVEWTVIKRTVHFTFCALVLRFLQKRATKTFVANKLVVYISTFGVYI